MEWQTLGNEAWAQLADARLVVLKNFRHAVGTDRGWRWVVVPMVRGHLDLLHPIQSTDMTSETEPYPTLSAAMGAVERYYVREWHGV